MKEIPMKPVDLKIRWEELFGKTITDIPKDLKRERWEQWKALVLKEPDGQQFIDWWTGCDEACLGCMHRQGDWCGNQQLPCTVNPVLTFSENIKGMACMGTSYQPGQMNMF